MNRPEIRASACDRPISAPRVRMCVPCSERKHLYMLPSLRAEVGALGPTRGCPRKAGGESVAPSLRGKTARRMISESVTCVVSTGAWRANNPVLADGDRAHSRSLLIP